jgi:hypothetical protein
VITKTSLPTSPTKCSYSGCAYYKEGAGVCSSPRLNRGNSDAACFRTPPKKVLAWLEK